MAILRRAEGETRSNMARLKNTLQECRTRCHNLEKKLRVSQDLAESCRKDNKRLTSEVKALEITLRIAQENASRDQAKLKSTEAQVSKLLSEKQQSSAEHAALVQHVLGLEVACQQFRRRAV